MRLFLIGSLAEIDYFSKEGSFIKFNIFINNCLIIL